MIYINYQEIIIKYQLQEDLLQGQFGLEKENLRITTAGQLALSPHPQQFGTKDENPYITTDFAESQLEMISPICASPQAALAFILNTHNQVSTKLYNELLWPYSLPPALPSAEQIQIAQFITQETTDYRIYLANKYGKYKQLISGVHYNYSLSDALISFMYDKQVLCKSFIEFRNAIYLKLAKFYIKHCWVIVHLFGASPVMHCSWIDNNASKRPLTADSNISDGTVSYRNGSYGYRNDRPFFIDHNTISGYISSIQEVINRHVIISPKEFYAQIRLKSMKHGDILRNLALYGIDYLEIRTLDLNPLVDGGITLESLQFIHLFMLYGLLIAESELTESEYHLYINKQLAVADGNTQLNEYHLYINKQLAVADGNTQLNEDLTQLIADLIQQMRLVFIRCGFNENQIAILYNFQQSDSYSNKIVAGIKQYGYLDFFLHHAVGYN